MLLCTVALGNVQDLPHDNALRVKIILFQLLKDMKHLIQHVEEHARPVAGSLEVNGSTRLAFICWHVKVGQLLICMAPDRFIAFTATSVEAALKDHIESENKSQTS